MRHSIAGSKLNRDAGHRRALIKNQTRQLLELGHLQTTETKGKIIAGSVESVLQKARMDSVHVRRQLRTILSDTSLVKKACDLASNLGERRGGMVKIIRMGRRRGDNVMMVKLELLVTLPVIEEQKKDEKSPKKETKVKKETKKEPKKSAVKKTKK
jgi:large subunit ribosomal protein L17